MQNHQEQKLKNELVLIIGSNNVITGDLKTKSYRTGIRVGEGSAIAVVTPNDLIQLWKVVKLCVSRDKILIIQAANTSLTGGSTPNGDDYDRDVVIINTMKLDKLIVLNKGNEIIAFPGATLYKLEKELIPLNREPHSVIGSSCIGASIVGGICNNSGGNLINRGPAYTELSLYARLNINGELELINHLGINLGNEPEEILTNLQNSNFDSFNIAKTKKKGSDNNYKYRIRDSNANTPARYNADKRRLYEASGCAGKIVVFAVRLDTFPKTDSKQVFYIGSNEPSTFTQIRKDILINFNNLPDMMEYMHYSSFDGASKYGKDIFLIIKYLGKHFMPLFFKFKRLIDLFISIIPFIQENIFDQILQLIVNFLPDHLPNRVREFRYRFNHYLIIVSSDSVIGETKNYLKDNFQMKEHIDYFECNEKEGSDILLHRYVSGLAPKRSQVLNNNLSSELLPLDIALPRNCENWYELIPEELINNSYQSFQMAHFMCMVFHWDFVLKKDADYKYLKEKILKQLDQIGAKYPAEHNVGHFYKADEELANFYKELDPVNCFNAGIGQLSKNKFYK